MKGKPLTSLSKQEVSLATKAASLLAAKERLEAEKSGLAKLLPHLHGWKFYKWARAFFECRNPINLLCAANQISKSSTAIRKNIEWATNKSLWKDLWATTPKQFWYLYPSSGVATAEFQNKWVPEFMPKMGQFINERKKEECVHPVYGWKAIYQRGEIHSIEWTSGVTIYFKTYAQNVHTLQAGSVYLITCFTAGHLVLTSKGLRKIEEIEIGELVWTRNGWNPVVKTAQREDWVSDKVKGLECTDNHRFWTDKKWVKYKRLTQEHQHGTVPLWKLLEKLYYLKESCSQDIRIVMIPGIKIISWVMLKTAIVRYMFLSGKVIIKNVSQKGMSFTTKTSILLITGYGILSSLLGVSIQESTKKQSGKSLKKSLLHAQSVVKDSYLDRLKTKFLDIVLKNVDVNTLLKNVSDANVITKLDQIHLKDFAPHCVQTEVKRKLKKVYSISVANTPEYVTNGYQVHNCDEELPSELYPELAFRTEGVGGYYQMVFTATRNQLMWYLAIEAMGTSMENFKSAFKQQVTMYDCLEYEDGSPGHFNEAKIERAIAKCASSQEVERRVKGRFVQEQGRKYPTFDPAELMIKPFPIPRGWSYYGGVDPGSGGVSNHPSGMGIIAVNPECTEGYVVDGWRGDKIETSAGDTLNYYLKMAAKWPHVTRRVYDQADKDFDILSTRMGVPFEKADKSHDVGESIVNTLFKNNMLKIFDTDELQKLARELMMLMSDTDKRKAEDDLIDGALRYPAMSIPWDFSNIKVTRVKKKVRVMTDLDYRKQEIDERRGIYKKESDVNGGQDFYNEVDEWNDAYG